MKMKNSIFEQNYQGYLNQLDLSKVSIRSSELGVKMTNDGQAVQIPFFNRMYQVSKSGIRDCNGQRPDYSTCVILLKYLLMNPPYVSENKEWITFREFKDAGRGSDDGLSSYALQKIKALFSARRRCLEQALKNIGSILHKELYPYDICAVVPVLPKIPLLFLFNDVDERFPAQALVLYERRAECFLDAECRVMVNWCLFELLKREEKAVSYWQQYHQPVFVFT